MATREGLNQMSEIKDIDCSGGGDASAGIRGVSGPSVNPPGLKLYVWHKSLIDWTAGVMFALAASEDEAKALILKDCSYIPDNEWERDVTVYDKPAGFAVWGGG